MRHTYISAAWRKASCALALSLLTLAACSDEYTAPEESAAEYDLIFEGAADGSAELHIKDAISGEIARLFPEGMVLMDPSPLPDGTRIVAVVADYTESTGDIFIINRDGSGLTQLTFSPELDDHPAVSPDGTRIAFRSFRNGLLGDIWVMNIDGTNPVNLTPDPLPGVTDESRPSWSPDGSRIAFTSNVSGNYDIWTMAADGSDRKQITSSIDFDTEAVWSPGGTHLVFRRSTITETDLVLIPSAGGSETRFVRQGHERLPVWSPDGSHIVFVHHATFEGRPDLYRMNPDGSGFFPLVTSEIAGGSLNPQFIRRNE